MQRRGFFAWMCALPLGFVMTKPKQERPVWLAHYQATPADAGMPPVVTKEDVREMLMSDEFLDAVAERVWNEPAGSYGPNSFATILDATKDRHAKQAIRRHAH